MKKLTKRHKVELVITVLSVLFLITVCLLSGMYGLAVVSAIIYTAIYLLVI